MKENHHLALIIAFYLSKFDVRAVKALGDHGFTQAFIEIGGVLNVKWRTIRNMRDSLILFMTIHVRVGTNVHLQAAA